MDCSTELTLKYAIFWLILDQKISHNYELGSKVCQESSDPHKKGLTRMDHLVQLMHNVASQFNHVTPTSPNCDAELFHNASMLFRSTA